MNNDAVAKAAYEAAEKLLPHHRSKLVFGGKVTPVWIDRGARFWYRVNTPAGREFVLADPADGTRAPAFDHRRLAGALAEASGQAVAPGALPFTAIEWSGEAVEFGAFGEHWRCTLTDYTCRRSRPRPAAAFTEVPSPDGRHALFRRDHDLWVRSLADGRERPLTADGQRDRDYATAPDWWQNSVLVRKLGYPTMPPAAIWSPDGTRVLTHRTDQRGVRRTHLIESLPHDGGPPRLHTQRYAFAGDERLPLAELVVVDVATGTVVRAQAEPLEMSMVSPVLMQWVWWSDDGTSAYYLSRSRDGRALSLRRLDPSTGEVSTLLTETGETRVEPNQWAEGQAPMVEVLSGGAEVVWFSQRDGWGHLYLHDARTGELLRRLTSGSWAVREILHIDQDRRVVYFTAAGLVEDDPYRRSVCSVGLDGSGFTRITGDELDHSVTVAPNRAYFVDSASTTGVPPVISVRGWDGRVLVELERADVTRLAATGWSPPERIRVKAADGVTDLYGLLYRPHGFDPTRRYPVVDHPYPGPQTNRVSPTFDPGMLGHEAEGMAALGFVVVAVDGRGTPGRDKAFLDASRGDPGNAADQVAALRQLGRTRPWMDLDRVGVVGVSAGGHMAVRAMCDHPGVYKVGIAGCGVHEPGHTHAELVETYQGLLEEDARARVSNVARADRLQGRLLLIHGGMDPNVLPEHTMRLVERLVVLDKDFEMLIVPEGEHLLVGYEHHVYRRRWDFLVRHLMGAEPPDHRISPLTFDAEFLADWF